MIKSFFTFLLFSISSLAFAQNSNIQYVDMGINGLHCSACSFTVEKSLRKVEGVSLVQMDLNERSGKIFFQDNTKVKFEKLAKAIVDAGYSVRYLKVQLREEISIDQDCSYFDHCLLTGEKQGKTIRLISKAYLPKKEWKSFLQVKNPPKCSDCDSESYASIIQS